MEKFEDLSQMQVKSESVYKRKQQRANASSDLLLKTALLSIINILSVDCLDFECQSIFLFGFIFQGKNLNQNLQTQILC